MRIVINGLESMEKEQKEKHIIHLWTIIITGVLLRVRLRHLTMLFRHIRNN